MENVGESEWYRNKCLEKYGVDHPYKLDEFKEKRKQTNLEKYGVESPMQLDEFKEKRKQTCLEKYGVESPMQSEEIKEKRKQTNLEYNQVAYIDDKPLFSFFAPKIDWVEEVRPYPEDERFLQVKCKKCGEWFIPFHLQLKSRIKSMIGKQNGECNFYCSDECKNTCSIFHQKLYRRGENPNEYDIPELNEWSKMVRERDNYTCQRCGKPGNIAHHIKPKKAYPLLMLDIDNGICVCEDCHYNFFHKLEGCGLQELANKC